MKEERDRKKAAAKGHPVEGGAQDEAATGTSTPPEADIDRRPAQRQQPKRQSKSQRQAKGGQRPTAGKQPSGGQRSQNQKRNGNKQ
jgi:YidC/Oxa1 family membrane protein insertase